MLASLFSFCHHKSIGKSSMTKNMTTASMMRSRNRGRMSQSAIHVFPLLPKSLFTISEDDNSNTIKPQGSISDSAFNSTNRTICSPQALHVHHNVFSLYYNDDDDDDDDGNSSNSNSTPSSSHADILMSVLDTLSAFDYDDDNEDEDEDEKEEQPYLSSRHEFSRWNTGEYKQDNSISCNTPTSRITHHNKNRENNDMYNTTSMTSRSRSSSCPLSSSSTLSSTSTPYHNRNNTGCVVGIDRPPTRPTRSRRSSCQF